MLELASVTSDNWFTIASSSNMYANVLAGQEREYNFLKTFSGTHSKQEEILDLA